MLTPVDDESMPMQPTSMAFALEVVTAGTVPVVAVVPDADRGIASSGVFVLTPEYRAMPPAFFTDALSVHVYEVGSELAATL